MKSSGKRFQPYLQTVSLLLIVAALYSGSLHAPFVFDDIVYFSDAGNIAKYGHKLFSFDLRWLSYATFSWTANWFGLDIFWLRLGNVILHAANAIALFFFLQRLFQVTLACRETTEGVPSSSTWYAFFGALLFALHPVTVYGVAYLVQRSTLMATLFVLLMLRVYLEGLVRGGWYWMLAAVLFYFAALYSKEHSILAPGVAFALTFLIRKPSVALLKQVAPYVILFALLAAAVFYMVIRMRLLGVAYEPYAISQGVTNLPNIYLLSILTQTWLFFKYLGLWLLPNPAWMSVDMREPLAVSLFGWHTLGLIAFLAYFCVAVRLLIKQGRTGLLGFALLFPWILFLTELSTVRIQEPFVLYRSYMWMPGLFAALPAAFGWLSSRKAFILLGATSLLLIPLALNRLHTFSATLLLWSDAEKLVRNRPYVYGAERIYFNRGTELGHLGRYTEAISDFNKAIAAPHPLDFMYDNRATAYYSLGRYQEALRDFTKAIAINPGNPNSYNGRALTYRALGNFAAARDDFTKSCTMGGYVGDLPCNRD